MSLYNPGQAEEEILKFWKAEGIYKKVKRASSREKPFYFMDGPPYATGSIHMGTALNKILKDAYIRFFRMLGHNVWDQPGYDTHGTPIETKVEKELGFKSKKDIEGFGVGNFVNKCRGFATMHIDIMNEQFSNLGVWMDWENPYLTLTNRYIEGAWFTFKKAFEKGFLFKGRYPVHVCPRCATVLAYNEIDYTKQTDTAVYVKFKLKKFPNKYLVAWTTTPWTLPGNTGVMAHPKFTYAEAELSSGEVWIVAKEKLQGLMDALEAGYKIIREFPGKGLEGLEYEPCISGLRFRPEELKGAYRVVLSDRYVNLEEGTGLVHTAPGHGREDFEVGNKTGLPALCPVDVEGLLTEEAGKYAGGRAREVDQEIIKDLEENSLLVYKHPYTHDYPICWRCESPLLQVGIPQWFFRVTSIRRKLLEENRRVNWVPEWAGERFRDWLENLGDWPVSRQRYWGIPLPIWECPCGNIEVMGSFEELKKKSMEPRMVLNKAGREIDFHRPDIDRVQVRCSKCGKPCSRIPDVLDVWFDSGVSTWASLGYPRDKKLFKKMWPSDFQVEGPDQFRGWWNSQIITSILTFGRAPYRNILLHGMAMDVKGIKLSKSRGNFISPDEVIAKHGRDALRFYLLSNTHWENFYLNWEDLKEVSRMLNILWNIHEFITTYGGRAVKRPGRLLPEDQWILSRLEHVKSLTGQARGFQMFRLAQALQDFILNDLSRWYVKIVRDRVSPTYNGRDKAPAQWTLRTVMAELVKLLAPISPFISERIYRDIGKKESVHMESWPKSEKAKRKPGLENGMDAVKLLVEACQALRQEKGLKLRWPVDKAFIEIKDHKLLREVKPLKDVICSMCNVKDMVFVSKVSGRAKEFQTGKIALGKALMDEALVRELVRQTQLLRKEAGLKVHQKIGAFFNSDKKTLDVLKRFEKDLLEGVNAKAIQLGEIQARKGELAFEGKRVEIGFLN